MQSALRGPIESSNFYVTRTELHELLANTFASLGATDRAMAHFDVVARNWQYGEEPFRDRAARAASESVRLRHHDAGGHVSNSQIALRQ